MEYLGLIYMKYEIVSIQEAHIQDFWSAVDSVARERKYLAFLEGDRHCARA